MSLRVSARFVEDAHVADEIRGAKLRHVLADVDASRRDPPLMVTRLTPTHPGVLLVAIRLTMEQAETVTTERDRGEIAGHRLSATEVGRLALLDQRKPQVRLLAAVE